MNEAFASEFQDVPEVAQTEQHGESVVLKPFTIWRPSQFLEWVEPPDSHLLLPAYFTKGELTTFIGQGGLGKTRLALWLAIDQILQRPWCGLETGGTPQKWLLLGDENSILRYKADLLRILDNFTKSECQKIDEFLRLQAILDAEDADLNLGDAITLARVRLTIREQVPGCIIADPLVNFAPGDISKPGEMKEATRLLLSTFRKEIPSVATFLLHHARTGRTNIAQGVGYDSANYASGGKPLFAASRCQINLMPGRADDDTRLVLSCAKANNCQKFQIRGLIFDPVKFTYTVDPDFDPAAWLADVEGRAHSSSGLCTVADIVAAVQDGYIATKDLCAHIQEAYGISKRSAERLIVRAMDGEGIAQLGRGRYTLGRKSEKFLNNKFRQVPPDSATSDTVGG